MHWRYCNLALSHWYHDISQTKVMDNIGHQSDCEVTLDIPYLLLICNDKGSHGWTPHYSIKHFHTQELMITWPHFLSPTQSKLRLYSANHRAGYFHNLACDWLSIVLAYSEQEKENGLWCARNTRSQGYSLAKCTLQILYNMGIQNLDISCTFRDFDGNDLMWKLNCIMCTPDGLRGNRSILYSHYCQMLLITIKHIFF